MNTSQRLRPLMFVGTGSDVGKSVINAAFCRILKQEGFSPAPFKAQNMSLNSYATADGKEIGRAQAMQAEACRIACSSDMNPILLKPNTDQSAQVVLNGKPIGNQTASQYFLEADRNWLFQEAMSSYRRLEKLYNPIVLEGAGSISEINLRDKDVTNMRVAVETQAAVFLIADIDRGGIFGSVYGTLLLLPPEERKLIKGIIINKFRGDISLFATGKKMLEELTDVPVAGIIPWFRDIYLDDEDSVVLDSRQQFVREAKVKIAVVLLRHMSNFTDFNALEQIEGVHLYYAANSADLASADIVIIPGSKNTIGDLNFLRQTGMAQAILLAHKQGKSVYGICGGFQMMGKVILDPYHMEGNLEAMPGLGILPVSTTITREKTTEQCRFQFLDLPEECLGYEIHMGETITENNSSLCTLSGGKADGYYLNPQTWGTYMHGIFDNTTVVQYILSHCQKEVKVQITDYHVFKEEQYDKLAAHVREHIDLKYFLNVMR
jgi:adenosylcobyric acid synthase